MASGTSKPSGHRRESNRAAIAAMGDEVSPIELLFDLVFVFALSQLSDHLLENLTARGALETVTLLMAVFGIWSLTSFGVSLPGITRRAAVGSLVIVLMLGVFFNAGLTSAFEETPWLFAVPFLLGNVGIVIFYRFTSTMEMRGHGSSMLVWVIPSTALWIVGALAEPSDRVGWWFAAALIDLVGAWSAHPLPGRRFRTAEVPFQPAHMLERSRLFLIIALGETILTTGNSVAGATIDTFTVVCALLAVGGIIALWALYFAGSAGLISERVSEAGDPLRAARLAINGQVLTAAGLIATAVGYEIAIEEPDAPAGVTGALLLIGGPVLYLGLQTWYLRALTGRWSRSRLVSLGVGVVLCGVVWLLPLVAVLALSTGLLGLLAFLVFRDARSLHGPLSEPVTTS